MRIHLASFLLWLMGRNVGFPCAPRGCAADENTPLAPTPLAVSALGNVSVVTNGDFVMLRWSPEADALREPMTVIKYVHGVHDFLMEAMCFDGIYMLSRVVLGCREWLPIPDCPSPLDLRVFQAAPASRR